MRGLSAAILSALAILLIVAAPSARQDLSPVQLSFDEWLSALRVEALGRGITQATVDHALGHLTPEPVVVARDRAQPEQTQSLDAYVAARLSRRTIASARLQRQGHDAVLRKIEARYGVPASVVVAVWGLESNFGQFTGVRPTIAALATLAYDSRRSTLFRSELFAALTILDRGLIRLEELKGSWAGAMGQPQFMPSSYLKHAVDFDEDGRADIWGTKADVFASIANYMRAAGWTTGERWGREVKIARATLARIEHAVPMRASGCRALREMTEPRPLAEWAKLGVTLPHGGRLPAAAMDASLVRGRARHFLVYRNYQALIDYNCSNSYAVSAGLLADQLGG